MSENQKVTKSDEEKLVTRYDIKLQKREEEQRKEQRRSKINKIIGLIFFIAILLFIMYFPIRNTMAKNATYITIEGEKITEVEFSYYYQAGINNYVSQYGSFLSYMGLDTTKDFASQAYSDTMTWADFFQQSAVNGIQRTKALLREAKAAGFEYDATADVANNTISLERAAEEAGLSVSDYIKAYFGKYATSKNILPFVEESYLASAYYNEVAESKRATDEEISAYYEDNKNTYDSVDFKLIEVAAELPAGETTTDADGKTVTADPTQEQIDAAMVIAAQEADKKLETVDAEGELKENMTSATISSLYNSWLFDATRRAGDKTVIEDTTNNKYYVLQFESRYLDQKASVNIRVILSTQGNGAEIVEEWNTTGANEDAFIALVEKHSEDISTITTGGLYENLQASGLDGELSAWMLDESRKPGDVGTVDVTAEGNTYVMYYIGAGQAEWQVSISDTLLAQAMGQYLVEIVDTLNLEDPKENLTYLKALEVEATSSTETQSTGN